MATPAREPTPMHTAFMYMPHGRKDIEGKMQTAHNFANIPGYLPGVSIITGIARVIFAIWVIKCVQFPKKDMFREANKIMLDKKMKAQILRGFLEVMQIASIALLITDLVHTLHFKPWKQPA